MTSTSMYFLNIADNGAGEDIAFAFGDLAEVTFVARRRIADLAAAPADSNFTVTLIETEKIGANALADSTTGGVASDVIVRTVTEFTGDGDTAAVVLKRKLAAERKQAAGSEQEQGETGDSAADTQQL